MTAVIIAQWRGLNIIEWLLCDYYLDRNLNWPERHSVYVYIFCFLFYFLFFVDSGSEGGDIDSFDNGE